jgi:tetratricopeptide (TPR) repeat protein
MVGWMNARELGGDALTWMNRLPPEVRNRPATLIAMAECHAAQRNWGGMAAFLREPTWSADNHLRLGMLSLALRNDGKVTEATEEWSKALAVGGGHAETLTQLFRLAVGRGLRVEADETLWTLIHRYPLETWAYQALQNAYQARKDSVGMLRLAELMARQNPDNLLAKNNQAMLSLLLKTNLAQAHRLAEEVYSRAKANGSAVSTYAYSLHLQGKTLEALRLFESMDTATLAQPGVSAYYGLLLASSGDTARAERFLARIRPATLLPEEEVLFASRVPAVANPPSPNRP